MFEAESKSKSFILGMLAGGIIGSISALLYAPKSGKKLRREIANKRNELFKEADKLISNAKDKASEIISESKKKSKELINEAKKYAGSVNSVTEKIMANVKAPK